MIASPKLLDPNFYRTVLLMVQHDEQEGAMALVLNRPTQTYLRDIWPKVSDGECRRDGVIFHGGPCEGPLMLLHTHEPASQIEIGRGLHLSSQEEQIRWLVENDGGPFKAFVGYAGWSPGQLESELTAGSWLHIPAADGNLIEQLPDWDQIIAELTPDVIEIKIVPPDPSLN